MTTKQLENAHKMKFNNYLICLFEEHYAKPICNTLASIFCEPP